MWGLLCVVQLVLCPFGHSHSPTVCGAIMPSRSSVTCIVHRLWYALLFTTRIVCVPGIIAVRCTAKQYDYVQQQQQ